MSKSVEIAANVFNAASILLAARNSFHTWWVGIVGCVLFGWVFFRTQLYADVTLQIFFIVTSARYLNELSHRQVPFLLVTGSMENRIRQIRELFAAAC